MKASVMLIIFGLALSSVLAAPQSTLKLSRGTPAEYLEATTVAANGIWPALGQGRLDILAALEGSEQEVIDNVESVLGEQYQSAADIFIPALAGLEEAVTDEEAELIVVETIKSLIMVGLATEYRIEDAIVSSSQVAQDQVQSIMMGVSLITKNELKPLWVLTEASRHHL